MSDSGQGIAVALGKYAIKRYLYYQGISLLWLLRYPIPDASSDVQNRLSFQLNLPIALEIGWLPAAGRPTGNFNPEGMNIVLCFFYRI